MIRSGLAESIVRECFGEAVDTNEEYTANKPPSKFSIISNERVGDLRIEIRKNKKVGVLAFNHMPDFEELNNIDSDTHARAVESIIMSKAAPVQPKVKKKRRSGSNETRKQTS